MTTSIFWLLFSLVCFLGELSSPGMFYFFSCSIVAFGLALWNYYAELSLATQGLLFFSGSFAMFFLLHRLMKKIDNGKKPQYVSHATALINREGIVLTPISGVTPGQLVIHNEVWLAYSTNKEQIIKKGEHVIIIGIKGTHLIVKSKEKS